MVERSVYIISDHSQKLVDLLRWTAIADVVSNYGLWCQIPSDPSFHFNNKMIPIDSNAVKCYFTILADQYIVNCKIWEISSKLEYRANLYAKV